MAFDEKLADRVRNRLSGLPDFEEKTLMGGLCFMYKGKMAFGVSGSELIVGVIETKIDELLRRPECRPMDFTGRVMSGFVFVNGGGVRSEKQLRSWLELGIEFVEDRITAGGNIRRRRI